MTGQCVLLKNITGLDNRGKWDVAVETQQYFDINNIFNLCSSGAVTSVSGDGKDVTVYSNPAMKICGSSVP